MSLSLNSIEYKSSGGAKARNTFPKTPADVEINLITSHALTMDYKLFTKLANFDLVEIEVTEATGRKETVQAFDPELKVCSCEQYYKIGVGSCKHIAVINTILKHATTIDERLYSVDLNKQIRRLSKSKSKKYIVYDSYKGSNVALGTGPFESRAVSCAANEKHLAEFAANSKTSKVELDSPYTISDDISLYDYQHDILEKMISSKRAVCSMVMGSGKSLTSIAGIKHLGGDAISTLIIAPKSIVKQWIDEFKRALGINAIQLSAKNIDMEIACPSAKVQVITYQLMCKYVDKIKLNRYDVVIADEIQFIKNDESKTWKALSQLKSEYFWGLSGTIIENKLDDLYSIMQIINPGLFGPKWKFDFKFKKLDSMHRKKVLYKNELQNLEELRELISDNVFSYDALVLPKITHHKIFLEMDTVSREVHDTNLHNANTLISKSLNTELSHFEKLMIQAYLLKARQACNSVELITKIPSARGEKLSSILKFIKDICLVQGEKLVIFSEWTSMLGLIEREMCLDMSIDYVRFDGSMSVKARSAAVDRFKSEPLCKVFFSSDAGGIGLDGLQLASSKMMHVELPWNSGKLAQRNGRLHRLKQINDVDIYYMITKDSIEEKMDTLLAEKGKIRSDVLF